MSDLGTANVSQEQTSVCPYFEDISKKEIPIRCFCRAYRHKNYMMILLYC